MISFHENTHTVALCRNDRPSAPADRCVVIPVVAYFKKLTPKRVTSSPVAHADVALICELDEQ